MHIYSKHQVGLLATSMQGRKLESEEQLTYIAVTKDENNNLSHFFRLRQKNLM